jgi:hypothetical protein
MPDSDTKDYCGPFRYQFTDENGEKFDKKTVIVKVEKETIPDSLSLIINSYSTGDVNMQRQEYFEETIDATLDVWLEQFPNQNLQIHPVTIVIRYCKPFEEPNIKIDDMYVPVGTYRTYVDYKLF